MFEDEKNYITDADIKKHLEFENKASMIYLLVLFPVLIVSVLLFVLFTYNAIENIPYGFDLELLGSIVIALFFLAFILFCVCYLITCIKKINKTKKLEFSVVKDKLVRIEERIEYSRVNSSTRIIRLFHFRDHGEYRVTQKDGSAFDYSSEDDIFYLVLYCGSKSPSLAYNAKVYDYRRT